MDHALVLLVVSQPLVEAPDFLLHVYLGLLGKLKHVLNFSRRHFVPEKGIVLLLVYVQLGCQRFLVRFLSGHEFND